MGLLAWVIMGLAVWHFTIWLPDRFWGGIVGAFIGSIIGAMLFGLIIHGFSIPGTRSTHLITAIEGIPGSLIGMAADLRRRHPTRTLRRRWSAVHRRPPTRARSLTDDRARRPRRERPAR